MGYPNDPRGSSLGCLVVIGSGGVLESGFVTHLTDEVLDYWNLISRD